MLFRSAQASPALGEQDGLAMIGGMTLWMLLWAAVVLGAVWLARSLRDGSRGRPREVSSAEEVLRRRYAAGEIDEDEYLWRLSESEQS